LDGSSDGAAGVAIVGACVGWEGGVIRGLTGDPLGML
jgi:hypothetical protein